MFIINSLSDSNFNSSSLCLKLFVMNLVLVIGSGLKNH